MRRESGRRSTVIHLRRAVLFFKPAIRLRHVLALLITEEVEQSPYWAEFVSEMTGY